MKTERTRLRRKAERGFYDPEIVYPILDAMPLCHVSFIDAYGLPAVLPTIGWREGNHYYWHASNGARSLKAMSGKPVSVSVTIMDGYVLARSAMNHSMNFRSVVMYGEVFKVEGSEQKTERLKAMIEGLFPDRWAQLREINDVELKQTGIVGIEINEASAKVRNAGVGDDDVDLDFPCWSGVIPISYAVGKPIDDVKNQTGAQMNPNLDRIKIG